MRAVQESLQIHLFYLVGFCNKCTSKLIALSCFLLCLVILNWLLLLSSMSFYVSILDLNISISNLYLIAVCFSLTVLLCNYFQMECQSAATAAYHRNMENKLSNQMLEEPKCMSTGEIPVENASNIQLFETLNRKVDPRLHPDGNVGVATGNWGCGAFGGDLQLKSIIQWLAASQVIGTFSSYHFHLALLLTIVQI